MARMRGKVDVKGLKQFQKNLEKLNAEQLQQWNEAAVKELAARLLAKVIKRTPVGKPPKELKLMKQTEKVTGSSGKKFRFLTAEAAKNQKKWGKSEDLWAGYKGGTLRRAWTVGEVVKTGDQYTIDVINPVEYAPYVEFGHRGVFVPTLKKVLHTDRRFTEGKFMLTISEQELRIDAPRILMNKLNKLMGEAFS